MANELLDDQGINSYADYRKHLKNIQYYFFSGVLLFSGIASIPWLFPEQEAFEKALYLPEGFAIPVLIAIWVAAILTLLISIYKGGRYLFAKIKFHITHGK